MSASGWHLAIACTRAEAERIAAHDVDDGVVLTVSEPDPHAAHDGSDHWRLDAYFAVQPTRALLNRIATLVPSAHGQPFVAAPLDAQDWVTLSQAGFEPLTAGRFHIRTPDHPARAGSVDFVIPAGLAFGTGQHATTAGCLAVLDRLKQRGRRYRRIVDIGTGTGLLAFGAARLWPTAQVTASDIDPVSIAVVRDNAALNRIRPITTVVADGLVHPVLVARAPYDLVIANILAAPLIAMAPSIAASMMPGGTLLLAGLLDRQVREVGRAYAQSGLRCRIARAGEWPIIAATKRWQWR